MVGVLHRKILRRGNVAVRASASLIGSPSPSISMGQASTSSANTARAGILLSPAAELAPEIMASPPGHSLSRVVLPLSRDRDGATLARRHGVTSIIACSRCLLHRSAISSVGCTAMIGARWVSIHQPSQLSPTSVPPTCADFTNTTRFAG
jgi:hypothetical protein